MLINQEKWKCFGYKVPHYCWFVLSGGMCDIVQAFIDYGIYLLYVFEWERATVCWTLSYTISIIIRHFSHRLLVFGEFEGTYCSSLTRTYMTYSSSIVISMLTNHLIVSFLNYSHRTAWIITMLWTGIYNYFMLKASWGRKTPANGGVDAINNTIKAKEQSKTALEVDYRRVPTSV
jgi:putative flippase GtrA